MLHCYGTSYRHNCYIPHKSPRLGQYSLSFQDPKILNSTDKDTKHIKTLICFFLKNVESKTFYQSSAIIVVANTSPMSIFHSFLLLQWLCICHCYLWLIVRQAFDNLKRWDDCWREAITSSISAFYRLLITFWSLSLFANWI